MTTRTAALRALLEPHLSFFAAEHRQALAELLQFAEIGERARVLIAALSESGASATRAPRSNSKTTHAAPNKGVTKPATKSQPSSKSAGARPTRASRDGGMSLRGTILQVLRDAKKPLSLAELEAAVKATGYTSTSAAFSKVLAHTITQMKSELRRVGRGVYQLA
jgi:hypothetical protein